MRVLVMIKANKDSEAGKMPSEKLLTDMMKFNEDLMKSGMLLAGEGLHPSSKGKRVRFAGKEKSVIDGPFTETKELVAGFWIWQVKSIEEAVEWVKRIPGDTSNDEPWEVELRPVFQPDDFGDALTPEVRAKEERMRREFEARKG